MPTEYVAGLMFSPNGRAVALIRKERPDWMKGKLNAIGGKIEEGESPYEAMVREFKEETGLLVDSGWTRFLVLRTIHDTVIHFFYIKSVLVHRVSTLTDEHVDVYSVKSATRHICVSNVPWIMRMALSFGEGERCRYFEVNEKGI